MKKNKLKLQCIFWLPLLMLGISACSDDDNSVTPVPPEEKNIVEIAQDDASLSNLVAALQSAELVATLEGDGPFTVLAPTDAAFQEFLTENNFASLEAVPADLLAQVLLNHVLDGVLLSSADTGYYTTMATADAATDDGKMAIFYNNDGVAVFNGEADVVSGKANIDATNGVIHVVDAVVELPTVATFIDADPLFDTLDETLDADGQPDFDAVLSTANGTAPAPFTVFAPVNNAFTLLTEVPSGESLTMVLQHHVIPNSNILFADVTDGLESPATLQGDMLMFQRVGNLVGITDGAGNSGSEIILDLANIQANNGVIHGISQLLLPNTEEDDDSDS